MLAGFRIVDNDGRLEVGEVFTPGTWATGTFFFVIILGAALQALRTAILSTFLPAEQVVYSFPQGPSCVRDEGLNETLPSEVKLQILSFPTF